MKAKPKREPRSAADFIPPKASLTKLRIAAKDCRGCDLYKNATQTVFGSGAARARIMFVGEQPGDVEDREGKPFVGPAGMLLNNALDAAGIDRKETYVTNAVKHFKFERVGKRRLHENPNRSEVEACRPWLVAEIARVKPEIIVCLGATAARALIHKDFKVTRERGKFLESEFGTVIMATVHPSSILRARDDESRHREFDLFVKDLKKLKDAKH